MALPAYQTDDSLHFVLPHSRDLNNGIGGNPDTIKRLNEIYGMRKARHLTMDGSGYNGGVDLGEVMGLGQKPRLETGIERNALDSLNDNDITAINQLHFQLDMIEAAGSMVAQMEGIIAQLSTQSAEFSDIQKEKFLSLINNQATLEKINDGRLHVDKNIIAKLADESIALLKDLGQDNVLPAAFKDMTINHLRETATRHALPDIMGKLDSLERDLSPALLLGQSIETLKGTLQALLDGNDLDADLRDDITSIMERLDNIEDGAPLPRDIIKALEALSQKSGSEALAQNLATMKEANLVLKAEQSGMSLAQIKSVEALMDKLDAIKNELGDNNPELADQIKNTVDALDTKPAAIETLIKLTQLDTTFKGVDKTTLSANLAEMVTTAQEQTKFVTKIQTDTIAKTIGMDRKDVTALVTLYIDLDKNDAPKNEATNEIKQAILQLDAHKSEMGKFIALTKLESVLSSPEAKSLSLKSTTAALIASVASAVTHVLPKQAERAAKHHGMSVNDVKNIAEIHQQLGTVSTTPDLKQMIKHAMDSIARNPISISSIAAIQMLQGNKAFTALVNNTPSLSGMADKISHYTMTNMRQTAAALKAPVSTVLKIVDATIAIRTTDFPKTLQNKANTVLTAIEKSPLTVKTAAALSQFIDTVKQKSDLKTSPVVQKLNDALSGQLTHISRQVGLLPATIKSALAFVNPEKSIHNIAAYGRSLSETPKAVAKELREIASTISTGVAQTTISKVSGVIDAVANAGAKIKPALVAPIEQLADGAKQIPEAVKEKLLAIKDLVQQGFRKPEAVPTAPQPGQPVSNDPFANFQQAQEAPTFKEQFKNAKTFDLKVEVVTVNAIQSITAVFKGCGAGACGGCPVGCGKDFAKAAGKAAKEAARVFTNPLSFLKKLTPKMR